MSANYKEQTAHLLDVPPLSAVEGIKLILSVCLYNKGSTINHLGGRGPDFR